MRQSYFQVFDEPSEKVREMCVKFGYASSLMSLVASHKMKPLNYLMTVISPAISHRQVKFYFNDDGNPVGFIVWALLDKDVDNRFISSHNFGLHESEWNEGNLLWIMDFLILPGFRKYVVRHMRYSLFPDFNELKYFRLKRGRFQIRVVKRNPKDALKY